MRAGSKGKDVKRRWRGKGQFFPLRSEEGFRVLPEHTKGAGLSEEALVVGDIVPGLIVRHTSRRLGKLDVYESCFRLVGGKIAFSEFVDQVGDGYREILDFMMEHDLHPGRPEDVLFCIEQHATASQRGTLLAQLGEIYEHGRRRTGD